MILKNCILFLSDLTDLFIMETPNEFSEFNESRSRYWQFSAKSLQNQWLQFIECQCWQDSVRIWLEMLNSYETMLFNSHLRHGLEFDCN